MAGEKRLGLDKIASLMTIHELVWSEYARNVRKMIVSYAICGSLVSDPNARSLNAFGAGISSCIVPKSSNIPHTL